MEPPGESSFQWTLLLLLLLLLLLALTAHSSLS